MTEPTSRNGSVSQDSAQMVQLLLMHKANANAPDQAFFLAVLRAGRVETWRLHTCFSFVFKCGRGFSLACSLVGDTYKCLQREHPL